MTIRRETRQRWRFMGLDMYLHKRTYIWSETRAELRLSGVPDTVEPGKVCYIVEEAGYWRKANAIHQWIVENVQDGNDNCHTHEVSRAQLQALLRSVETVLAHPDMAARLLPTQEGFFFGGTEYDDGYVACLKETTRILTDALADGEAEFEYCSSW